MHANYNARSYLPGLGVFAQVDPIDWNDKRLKDPQQLNPYAYVRGNPLKLVDPNGKSVMDALKIGFGYVTASAVDVAQGLGCSSCRDYKSSDPAIQFGQMAGHGSMVVIGAMVAAEGVANTSAGLGAMAVPGGQLPGGALAAEGVVQAAVGASTSVAAVNNLTNSLKAIVGSYTITFASGKKYHGKGPESRAEQSAKERSEANNDEAVSVEWTPAADDKEAFKQEAVRIREDGGVDNPENYNERNSPGEKYLNKPPNN